ncbi:galactosylceramide sulfotransferase-like isoform X2 [Liolophura sinensis]|uniref:galactosylceramide sulfotransferase-like isoform X2 n=1 Tax=Liolophura sinensis TaxID=3198878 RepID=UPI00315933F0
MRFAWRVVLAVAGATILLFGYIQHRYTGSQTTDSNQNPDYISILEKDGRFTGNTEECREKTHFAFLKVPKAGSSTIQNILFRFGTLRWLTFVLPKYANYIGRSRVINDAAILPPPQGKKYEILCNHVMYDHSEFARILPSDAVFIGIVREPLPQLESYLYYYHFHDVPTDDKLTEYLDDPYTYALGKNIRPNPQTYYYGLDDRDRTNPTAIKEFISKIQREFDFIIVLERLDESLLLLKRKLCWKLTDILYIRKNTNRSNPRRARSHPQRTKHKAVALAEYRFYEHFQNELIREIVQQGVDFQNELDFYKNILRSVKSFCLDNRRQWQDQFYIPSSKWNPETNVSAVVCHVMLLPELQLLDLVGKRQYGQSRWEELHPDIPIGYNRVGKNVKETNVAVKMKNGQLIKKVYFNYKKQHNLEPPPRKYYIR